MNRFYVYAHYRADDGALFYIGKGSGRRAWSRSSRNRHWRAIEQRHGRTVELLREGLAEDEAFAVEAALIAACGVALATYTAGGKGIAGYRHTEKAKAAMTAKRKGRVVSEAAKQRMSETIRSRPDLLELRSRAFAKGVNPASSPHNRTRSSIRMFLANPMFDAAVRAKMAASNKGRTATLATRQKLSAALKGRKRGPMKPNVAAALAAVREARKRPVETSCGLHFESTASAARALGIRQGNIVNNCAGRAKTAGGYSWRYADALPV